MKSNGKRLFVGMLLLVMLACAGCTRKGICDECGQEAKLTKYELQGGMGNALDAGNVEYLCDGCLRMAKAFGY